MGKKFRLILNWTCAIVTKTKKNSKTNQITKDVFFSSGVHADLDCKLSTQRSSTISNLIMNISKFRIERQTVELLRKSKISWLVISQKKDCFQTRGWSVKQEKINDCFLKRSADTLKQNTAVNQTRGHVSLFQVKLL